MGWILFFIFIVFICFIAGWTTLGIILSVFAVGVIILVIYTNNEERKSAEERQDRIYAEKAKKENELQTVIIPAYNTSLQELVKKYGSPTKSIVIEKYNLNKEIIVFEEAKRIWICGNDLPMRSILSCTYSDSPVTTKGKITSTTNTNNSNMVKRAVIGNVLAGEAGAIIGGATASKTTVLTQGSDKVFHSYTVIINVNSLTDPIIRVPVKEEGKLVNEIIALMNVIISRR